ncbi:uncharacterized protein BKCO1_3300010 [Diplodia corticola]|uniref:DUF7580 domain-containing protein n=1 Tax=Diplodia corticola TaxID=236234 RepID=A0A1J9QVV8_9PEZI|nr:uncharacterized protein BKCO1_3300010 [Diplodia corticola]OJD33126.1 hypothetical protein BKCO1_3300010 [Diplodia corticola]
MSGIEVAGLVLGALPLIIHAITVYADGVSTVERYFKYEIPLRSLHRSLEAEFVIYQNTCEELLNGIVKDNEERAALLNNPGGPDWKKAVLEEKLKDRLSRSYMAYVGAMEDMKDAMLDMKKLLKLDKSGKVQLHPSSKFRKEYHRLRFSLKKSEYDGLVAKVQQLNATLRTLTQQTLALEPTRSKRQIPEFDTIRNYAAAVYNLICAGLKCGCPSTHGINLRLEGMMKCSSSAGLPPFRVVLSYSSQVAAQPGTPWTVEAVDIHPFQVQTCAPPTKQHQSLGKKAAKKVTFQPVAGQASAPATNTAEPGPAQTQNLLQIKNLCQTICSIKGSCIDTCLGYLEDDITKQRLSLHQPRESFTAQTVPSFLSLHSVLASNATGRRRLSTGHRLRLAVLLSTNLLQLHRTPWLTETWDHNDITFLASTGSADDFRDPFISRTPPTPRDHITDNGRVPTARPPPLNPGTVLNRPLFALGILLIELCLGQPFDELRTRAGHALMPVASAAPSDFVVADRLLDDVTAESGDRYADAVRRCVRCTFDTRKFDLEDEGFRRAVYEGVVAPLEENLLDFNGLVV